MALAIARVIVIIELFAKDVPVAMFVMSGFAFLADVVRASHKRGEGFI
jgi:hypothetical protein